jgi:hypothetical protein
MKILMILAVAYGLFWFVFLRESEVNLPPGVMVEKAPQQEILHKQKSFEYNDYHITPLANFQIKAKILSKMSYRFGREADLSPIDLALGWGSMSDERVLERIDISQSNRYFYWRTDDFPIPRKKIETQASNMHLIPADETIEKAIKQARKGEIVSFSGYLVRVDAEDGWHWVSSLSRSDTGGGACELIWVESFRVETP